MRIATTLLVTSAAALAAGATASAASAATMDFDATANVVTYTAASTEVNTPRVIVGYTMGGTIPYPYAGLESDGISVAAGTGCTTGPPLLCGDGTAPAPRAEVYLGDGDDDGYAHSQYTNTYVHGGDGDDEVYASGYEAYAYGDAGNDELTVSASQLFHAEGGTGDDKIRAFDYPQVTGDAGDDLIAVRLHGTGSPGTYASGGDDDDRVVSVGTESALYNGTLNGGDGDDIVAVASGKGGGYLNGNDGADIISAGSGNNVIDGGAGDDLIDAVDRDGRTYPDSITCGSGNDTVYAQSADTVAGDCETVITGTTPTITAADNAITDALDYYVNG